MAAKLTMNTSRGVYSDSGADYKCHDLLTYLFAQTRRTVRKQNVFSPVCELSSSAMGITITIFM